MLILEQIVERVAAETGLRQDQVTELNMYGEGARHTTNQRLEADLVLPCTGIAPQILHAAHAVRCSAVWLCVVGACMFASTCLQLTLQ